MSGVSRLAGKTCRCKRFSNTIKKVELLNDLPFSEGDTTFADYDSIWNGYTRHEGKNGGWYDLCKTPPRDWETDNKPVVEFLAENGYNIKVLPALDNIKSKYEVEWSNPDVLVNGFLSDIKNVEESIKSRLKSAKTQKLTHVILNIPASFSDADIQKVFSTWTHGRLDVLYIHNGTIYRHKLT